MAQTRRELMAERDRALAAGNIAEFQRLTRVLAEMPLASGETPTKADRKAWARYAAKKR